MESELLTERVHLLGVSVRGRSLLTRELVQSVGESVAFSDCAFELLPNTADFLLQSGNLVGKRGLHNSEALVLLSGGIAGNGSLLANDAQRLLVIGADGVELVGVRLLE